LNSAFSVLGIEPTTDGRLIRSAYLRVARIYHPDRILGMPEDVRIEAERRMKEATAAYASLRTAKKTIASVPPPAKHGTKDPWDDVRRVREAMAARRLEQEQSRKRWLLWEELERQARDRAAYEAGLAVLADEDPVKIVRHRPADPETQQQSQLSRRLETARGTRDNTLTPQR
jgi:hypothetical protein